MEEGMEVGEDAEVFRPWARAGEARKEKAEMEVWGILLAEAAGEAMEGGLGRVALTGQAGRREPIHMAAWAGRILIIFLRWEVRAGAGLAVEAEAEAVGKPVMTTSLEAMVQDRHRDGAVKEGQQPGKMVAIALRNSMEIIART
jgi:hypothetical protein